MLFEVFSQRKFINIPISDFNNCFRRYCFKAKCLAFEEIMMQLCNKDNGFLFRFQLVLLYRLEFSKWELFHPSLISCEPIFAS